MNGFAWNYNTKDFSYIFRDELKATTSCIPNWLKFTRF